MAESVLYPVDEERLASIRVEPSKLFLTNYENTQCARGRLGLSGPLPPESLAMLVGVSKSITPTPSEPVPYADLEIGTRVHWIRGRDVRWGAFQGFQKSELPYLATVYEMDDPTLKCYVDAKELRLERPQAPSLPASKQ